MMAGPCSVESEEQICGIAEQVKEMGADFLRGGAFKPRTSPYAFQGLKYDGLRLLKEARAKTGLPIVTEIMSPYDIELFAEDVDVIQVGARNMQNFELLKELGHTHKPILLKRGLSATIEEWLMSAEYIMAGGNENIILCERGIRTFETYTRNTLDLSAIPAVKKLSHLPVVVDPSHASGKWWMVDPLAKAPSQSAQTADHRGAQRPRQRPLRRPAVDPPERLRRARQGAASHRPRRRQGAVGMRGNGRL
ncbi:MAG: 3-deoxy-7-phosphoheptulonate synthase [Anaerotruncus massiliensis (ex Togo et al. 2019)]